MAITIANVEDKLLTSGDLYYSPNFDSAKLLTAPTAATLPTFAQYLTERDFKSVGHIKNFTMTPVAENEKTIRAGNCGVGELAVFADKKVNVTFDWLDVVNLDVLAYMFGLETATVTSAAVTGFVQTIAAGDWAYASPNTLSNQNGDLTAIVPTAVAGSVDGALALTTDYTLGTNDAGETTIVPVSGGAITTLTQDFNVTYDYTPYETKLTGFLSQSDAIPLGSYMFVSCARQGNFDTGTGLSNYQRVVSYFSKMTLSGGIPMDFVDLGETDFAGASMSLEQRLGGVSFLKKATWQA